MSSGFLAGGFPAIVPAGQFQVNLTYDSSTSGAPAGFFTAMNAAAAYLGSLIYLSKTISINVGWGEVNGGALGGTASSDCALANVSYATVRSSLIANATSANAIQAVSTLPSSAPSGVSSCEITYAQGVAFGYVPNSGSYAWIGFDTSTNWSYSGTPGAGQVDFREAALHEMTECMGRYANLGANGGAGAMSVLDLYAYSANGTRNLTSSGTRYFSIDGGATNQRQLGGAGDLGDWTGSGGSGIYTGSPSPFDGDDTTGRLIPLLPCDTLMIDVLGYSSQ